MMENSAPDITDNVRSQMDSDEYEFNEDYDDYDDYDEEDMDADIAEDEEEDFLIRPPTPRRYRYDRYGGDGGVPGGGSGSGRFRYSPRPSSGIGVCGVILIIIGIIIGFTAAFYGIPLWHAGISLQEQLYAGKVGFTTPTPLPFWEFLVLNYWSTYFIINKVGLIGGIIGCLIMSIPPERNLLWVIGTRLGFGRSSVKKTLLFWWTAGFGFFYLVGQVVDAGGYFGMTMYMIENGTIDGSPAVIAEALQIMVNPSAFDLERNPDIINAIFVYNNIYLPVILFTLGVLVFRAVLNLIGVAYLSRNDYKIAENLAFMVGLFFFMGFWSAPLGSYDGLGLILIWINPIAVIGLFSTAVYFGYLGRKAGNRFRVRRSDSKRMLVAVLLIILCIIIPWIISIPLGISIYSNYNVWHEKKWELQIKNQINWTRAAAGLDMFTFKNMQDLINAKSVPDEEIVANVRQYDKDAAISAMNSYAPSPFESLGDSDIVYVNRSEYWVAPKTLRVAHLLEGDEVIRRHTNMFDHVEGFLVIDTFTGNLLDSEEIYDRFGVNNTYPIFFGEHEAVSLSSSGIYFYNSDSEESITPEIGAFDDPILLNTGWQDDEANYHYKYIGKPDGELHGLEAFWFTTDLGLLSYALNESFPKQFLINRNIMTRVGSILLPGLRMDSDPYLVFNNITHTMYYAVSIYTDIPLQSYSQSNIMRFLGVVLVDTMNGTMDFFLNPMLEDKTKLTSDPTYPIWKIYLEKYPWHTINQDWLKEQLRYPEDLFEKQLSYEYIYHVQDDLTWRGGSQFHERPPNSDLFYVEFDLGEGLEFVGIDLVQRTTKTVGETSTLAGMYVLRHGKHFGECIFFAAETMGVEKMISPERAKSGYENAATQELALINPKDFGNILLYPLNNSLYYFIPTYAETGNLQTLRLVGFVNAFDYLIVGYGANAIEAYKRLPFYSGSIPEEENATLNTVKIDCNITEYNEWALITPTIKVNYNGTYTPYDITVNISVYSNMTRVYKYGIPLNASEFTWGADQTGLNYTVFNGTLWSGDTYSFMLNMTMDVENAASVSIYFRFIITVDGYTYIPEGGGLYKITFTNPETP